MWIDNIIKDAIARCDGIPDRQVTMLMGCLYRLYLDGSETRPPADTILTYELAKTEIRKRKKLSENGRKGGLQNIDNKANNFNLLASRLPSTLPSKTDVKQECGSSNANEKDGELIEYSSIVKYWNDRMAGTSINSIRSIDGKRRVSVRARLKEYGIDGITSMIDNVADSSFLKGDNNRQFTATFDWCFKPSNFPKILEGNYKDRNKNDKAGDRGIATAVPDSFKPIWEVFPNVGNEELHK